MATNEKMDGWKTKVGSAMTGVAIVLAGFGQKEKADAVMNAIPLLDHAAALVGGIGVMLTALGIGHKIQKSGR